MVDYSPLLPPGLHRFEREALRALTVGQFPASTRRALLFKKMLVFLGLLRDCGVTFEVWIDGSFLTEKPDPGDVDIALLFDPNAVDSLPRASQLELGQLLDKAQIRVRFDVDLYLVPGTNIHLMAYWRGWFGFCRDNVTAKGIAVMEII